MSLNFLERHSELELELGPEIFLFHVWQKFPRAQVIGEVRQRGEECALEESGGSEFLFEQPVLSTGHLTSGRLIDSCLSSLICKMGTISYLPPPWLQGLTVKEKHLAWHRVSVQ